MTAKTALAGIFALIVVADLALFAGPPSPASTPGPIKTRGETERWSNRIDAVGAVRAYEEFKTAYAKAHFGPQHVMAHLMGELLYEREGIAGFTICDDAFAFGCYHSFFGAAIADHGLQIVKQLDAACLDEFGPLGTGCQHGIGHGLMEYYGRDRLLEALLGCGETTQEKPIHGCTSGVFMEYNVPIVLDEENTRTVPRELNPGDPYAPCPNIPSEFRESCYYEMGQWWDKVFEKGYAKIGVLCAAVTDEREREACFLGVGKVAAPSSEYDVGKTIAQCKAVSETAGEILCRAGASWSFYSEPEHRAQSLAVCEGLSPEAQRQCVQKSDLIGDGKALLNR